MAVSGVASQQGGRPAAVLYPFGHPTPYAYDGRRWKSRRVLMGNDGGGLLVWVLTSGGLTFQFFGDFHDFFGQPRMKTTHVLEGNSRVRRTMLKNDFTD
jgi:hypothetical protein